MARIAASRSLTAALLAAAFGAAGQPAPAPRPTPNVAPAATPAKSLPTEVVVDIVGARNQRIPLAIPMTIASLKPELQKGAVRPVLHDTERRPLGLARVPHRGPDALPEGPPPAARPRGGGPVEDVLGPVPRRHATQRGRRRRGLLDASVHCRGSSGLGPRSPQADSEQEVLGRAACLAPHCPHARERPDPSVHGKPGPTSRRSPSSPTGTSLA